MRKFLFLLLLVASASQVSANRKRIDSLLQRIQTNIHDTFRVRHYYQLSKDYLNIDRDSSIYFANKCLEWIKKTGFDRLEPDAYAMLGVNAKNKGNFEEALTWQLKTLKMREERKDDKGLAITYNDIGILYKNMKRLDEALPYYKKANEIAKKLKLSKGISMTYNNMGTIYNDKGKFDSALIYYKLALTEAEQTDDNYSISTCLSNIGEVYLEMDKNKEALDIFLRCLQYDKANEDNLGMVLSYTFVGKSYSKLQEANKAIVYSDSAIALAKQEQLTQDLMEVMGIRSDIEKNLGNYKAALEFAEMHNKIRDSLMGVETSNNISELQTRYETEKRQHQIEVQQAELRRKNYVIAGISGFLLMALLLGLSSYRRYKLRQQGRLQAAVIEQQELATAAVIQAEERERKRIAGDLHDGVGQLMSAAKMNLSMIGSELTFGSEEQRVSFDKALSLVDESCREVRTVSHNIMPNALLRSGLASAIREFINKLDERVIKVNLYIEGMNERINSNIESVLYRVVQETVNNVIKHAGASQLDIALIKDEDGISVTIEDNGKGFDTSDKSKFNGIGIKNVQSRIDYLKGSVEWDSAPNKGTVVTIQVPA